MPGPGCGPAPARDRSPCFTIRVFRVRRRMTLRCAKVRRALEGDRESGRVSGTKPVTREEMA